MEKLKAMIRRMVQEEGFSRGSRKDKEMTKSRSEVLGMTQVEEEETPSFDMSKTSDRGDGNFPSGNLKESTIKNIIRQAIIDEAKNWPLMEGDVYAIVDKFNEKKQDYDQVYFKDNDLNKVKKHLKKMGSKYGKMNLIKVKTNGKMSVVEGIEEAKLKRFKVFIDGEKEPLILTGKNENDVKKFAHQMIHNNKVKITKVVKEALTESLKGKFVVASIYGDLYTPKAVDEKKAMKLMMKLADQYAGDNVFVLGAEYWNKPHKFNKKKIMVKEGFDLKELEIVIKSIQKKIAKQGRVTNARDEEHLKQLIKVYKEMGGRKIKEGKLTEAIGKGMFWDDLKIGTSIEYTGGTTYVVTKIDSNKLQMSLKRRGKVGGGLFAPKAMLDKSGFESQVKTGLIKYLVNTNPRVKEGKLTEGKTFKYKKNDWKKYNKLAKKKEVMVQTAFGDLFAWEEGSNYGIFATDEDGREIELDHDDIDSVEIF